MIDKNEFDANDDFPPLTQEEIDGINQGLEDNKNGRVFSSIAIRRIFSHKLNPAKDVPVFNDFEEEKAFWESEVSLEYIKELI